MLGLADIQLDILSLTILSDNHTAVNLLARSDEESTTLLSGEKTVSYSLACLESDEGTLFTIREVSLVWCISVKHGVQDTGTLGGGKEFVTESDQSTGRDGELKTYSSVACCAHTLKFTFTLAEFLDDGTGKFLRNINICDLDRRQFAAGLVCIIETLRFADCKFISFTAHVLNKNGKVKLTTAGNLEALSCICVFHTKADVCIQLTVEAVTKVTGSDKFTFLSCKRAVVYKEVHGDGRLGNLLERNGLRVISCTECISNVDICNTGDEGLKTALAGDYDLIILDLMLPGMDGFEVCKKIREEKNIPILMVSAKKDDIDKIRGLGLGADDYMTKPFSPSELVARVKSQLRRYTQLNPQSGAGNQVKNEISIKGLTINKDNHKVTVYGEEIKLTPIEFDILYLLASNPGRVFSTDEIFEKVWNEKVYEANNTVMVHIRRLRGKMKEDERQDKIITTVWGVGYKIEK